MGSQTPGVNCHSDFRIKTGGDESQLTGSLRGSHEAVCINKQLLKRRERRAEAGNRAYVVRLPAYRLTAGLAGSPPGPHSGSCTACKGQPLGLRRAFLRRSQLTQHTPENRICLNIYKKYNCVEKPWSQYGNVLRNHNNAPRPCVSLSTD